MSAKIILFSELHHNYNLGLVYKSESMHSTCAREIGLCQVFGLIHIRTDIYTYFNMKALTSVQCVPIATCV